MSKRGVVVKQSNLAPDVAGVFSQVEIFEKKIIVCTISESVRPILEFV